MLSHLVLGFTIFNSSHLSTLICSDLSWGFLGIPNSAGVFGEAVMSPEALRIQCSSKLVKIPMKCMLDNLKVIVVLRLVINWTSCLIQNLAWFGVLSCHILWQSYSNNMIEWYDQSQPTFFHVSFDILWSL